MAIIGPNPPMRGMYNIPEEDATYEYYWSVPELPSMEQFYEECNGLADRLREIVGQYMSNKGIPKYNEILQESFGKYAIGEYPSDRTMGFFVGDLRAFTPEFFHILQVQVLVQYSLWRLDAQFDEPGIGIYPNAVWLDNTLVTGRFDTSHRAYVDWLKNAEAIREHRFAPISRQLRYVQTMVSRAIPTVERERFAVLGVFDRFPPVKCRRAVWILQSQNQYALSLDCPSSPARESAVDDTGLIRPQYDETYHPYTQTMPRWWCLTYLLESTDPMTHAMKTEDGEVVGHVRSDQFMTDDELKEALS